MFATVLLAVLQQEPRFAEADGPVRVEPEIGTNAIELALHDETFWAAYSRRFDGGLGEVQVGVMGSDDDELVGTVRVMRFVEHDSGGGWGSEPFVDRYRFGVGLGVYALQAEEPDVDAQAITLHGSAGCSLGAGGVTRAVLDVAFAPDVSTFADGDQLLDLWLRLEFALSERAHAYLGYRSLEIELEQGGERDLGESVQIGVRLGW